MLDWVICLHDVVDRCSYNWYEIFYNDYFCPLHNTTSYHQAGSEEGILGGFEGRTEQQWLEKLHSKLPHNTELDIDGSEENELVAFVVNKCEEK